MFNLHWEKWEKYSYKQYYLLNYKRFCPQKFCSSDMVYAYNKVYISNVWKRFTVNKYIVHCNMLQLRGSITARVLQRELPHYHECLIGRLFIRVEYLHNLLVTLPKSPTWYVMYIHKLTQYSRDLGNYNFCSLKKSTKNYTSFLPQKLYSIHTVI